jgi:hypothetical protein
MKIITPEHREVLSKLHTICTVVIPNISSRGTFMTENLCIMARVAPFYRPLIGSLILQQELVAPEHINLKLPIAKSTIQQMCIEKHKSIPAARGISESLLCQTFGRCLYESITIAINDVDIPSLDWIHFKANELCLGKTNDGYFSCSAVYDLCLQAENESLVRWALKNLDMLPRQKLMNFCRMYRAKYLSLVLEVFVFTDARSVPPLVLSKICKQLIEEIVAVVEEPNKAQIAETVRFLLAHINTYMISYTDYKKIMYSLFTMNIHETIIGLFPEFFSIAKTDPEILNTAVKLGLPRNVLWTLEKDGLDFEHYDPVTEPEKKDWSELKTSLSYKVFKKGVEQSKYGYDGYKKNWLEIAKLLINSGFIPTATSLQRTKLLKDAIMISDEDWRKEVVTFVLDAFFGQTTEKKKRQKIHITWQSFSESDEQFKDWVEQRLKHVNITLIWG